MFNYFLKGRTCEPFGDKEAVFLEEDREEYEPDMMVVCDPDKVKADGIHGAPDLVVEVLSPSTARYDKGHKKDVYEKHGVREYWLVNPADQTLEQYVLEEGRFVLRGVFAQYPEFMLRRMSEAERAELVTEFQCSLFEDLTIRLEDVFNRVTPGV
ncbi:MAG: Uma2 family endonuclease [Oscillibacter sp.]|nr:Uma2 family endonuclease [Oscillibacter sp.]